MDTFRQGPSSKYNMFDISTFCELIMLKLDMNMNEFSSLSSSSYDHTQVFPTEAVGFLAYSK